MASRGTRLSKVCRLGDSVPVIPVVECARLENRIAMDSLKYMFQLLAPFDQPHDPSRSNATTLG